MVEGTEPPNGSRADFGGNAHGWAVGNRAFKFIATRLYD